MPPLPPNVAGALWAWPHVEQSAATVSTTATGILSSDAWPLQVTRRAGTSTANLWAQIREAAPDESLYRSIGFGTGLSRLRGYANRITAAQLALARAQPDWSINPNMVADAPWSRPLAEQNALGRWQVRIPVTGTSRQGVQVTRNITVMYQGSLPGTVADVVDQSTMAAANAAAASDFTVIATGPPQILAV